MAPAASLSIRALTASAGLSVADEHGAQQVVRELIKLKLVTAAGESFTALPDLSHSLKGLSIALAAIDHFAENIHVDRTQAQVVLTRPSLSSVLEAQLEECGWRMGAIKPTDQAFLALVQGAETQIVIMTPFLDAAGARWLKEMVDNIQPGVSISLVLRSLEDPGRADYPVGFETSRPWLAARGVDVFNYSIPRDDGLKRETFHAKVILADRKAAYVGSSNLTAASRDYSMEMGVILHGKAAREIAEVVNAVLRSASAVPLNFDRVL
jgi:phosphatidylserine/phosphatidylglycerophosphate/cardiolipin synthase-like enzyme